MYKKTITLVIILTFLLSSLLPVISSVKISSNRIIYVDDDGGADYTKIQDAIDNASDGDTVFVYSGTYFENIVVDKSITLEGEDKNNTIIDGMKGADVIHVINDGVTISGFTIQNNCGSIGDYCDDAGVDVRSINVIIKDNIIKNNGQGIYFQVLDSNNTFKENLLLSNTLGMKLRFSSDTLVSNNTFIDNYWGMRLEFVDNVTIIKNYFNNPSTVLRAEKIYSCLIKANNITSIGGGSGIVLKSNSNGNEICNNIITNNGKRYWSGIGLLGASGNVLSGNSIDNFEYGISVASSQGNVIKGNEIRNSYEGIILNFNAHDNKIYHNNLVKNNQNAFATGENEWDDGWKGNYWDDYEDKYPDANRKLRGVWDTPYEISNDNIDRYPVVEPYKHAKSYVTTNNNIIYVDDDGTAEYTRIQDAIDNASDGDTVFVYNGTYHENLRIDKTIMLLGENRNTTILDGDFKNHGILILKDEVVVDGFTIQNCGGLKYNIYAGIYVDSGNNTFSNNIFKNNCHYGLIINFNYEGLNNGNIIINNIFYNNTKEQCPQGLGYGLAIHSCDNIIKNNTFNNNHLGIRISGPNLHNNTIIDNKIFDNIQGIRLTEHSMPSSDIDKEPSSFHLISNNEIYSNDHGIYVTAGDNGRIEDTDIMNSKIYDNKIGIYLNGFLKNVSVSHCTIKNNEIGINCYGCKPYFSLEGNQNNTIYKNKITENYEYGIYLDNNWYHNIYQNMITQNNIGIYLDNHFNDYYGRCYSNLIYDNIISHNNHDGLHLDIYSEDNIIKSNSIELNKGYGISLKGTINTTIIENNIIFNRRNAFFEKSDYSTWNGNYWNRPRLLPYPIFGKTTFKDYEIPWLNIDWRPALKPYNITI